MTKLVFKIIVFVGFLSFSIFTFAMVKISLMKQSPFNKKKIINDPVYGFLTISHEIIFDLIEHPFFQRLRRIRQLGLTDFVYPGAFHSRFQHAIGATHLMNLAINVIRSKGHTVSPEEAEAVSIAILLHDIGHGPFSHSLEHGIVDGIKHEELSVLLMEQLNKEFVGKLDLAIDIFQNNYYKKFLHQLVSSQLDMDRLDYLRRDSFFTGVMEGTIGSDRIIKMLDVANDQLVVEAKGIYSIEKFLIARRLMYWQVYLHKTVLSAEFLMAKILGRAKYLAKSGVDLFATPSLKFFLYNGDKIDFTKHAASITENFSALDDYDVLASIKVWTGASDNILSMLSGKLIHRNLLRLEIQNKPFNKSRILKIRKNIQVKYGFSEDETDYFIFSDTISNNTYSPTDDRIKILYNTGELTDIAKASDMLNISLLSKIEKKYFLCYPKECFA